LFFISIFTVQLLFSALRCRPQSTKWTFARPSTCIKVQHYAYFA